MYFLCYDKVRKTVAQTAWQMSFGTAAAFVLLIIRIAISKVSMMKGRFNHGGWKGYIYTFG